MARSEPLSRRLILALVAASCVLGRASDEACRATDNDCVAHDDLSALQTRRKHARDAASKKHPKRLTINKDGAFNQDGVLVKPLGGNYCMKAHPWFVPLDVVRADAKSMYAGAQAGKYSPSNGAKIVPAVRYCVMWEGAMPTKDGGIDAHWLEMVEKTIEVFSEEGVYVFLDFHQDALSPTNGGEGMPYWVAAGMQETAAKDSDWYVVSPKRPLETVIPSYLETLLEDLKVNIPVAYVNKSDPDPWGPFSVETDDGDPANMAVGNVNIRLNNDDKAWSKGVLILSRQVNTLAYRWWLSPGNVADKAKYFDPYVKLVIEMCRVWERHDNVIAVELFNEPPIAGLPNIEKAFQTRVNLFNFYASVLLNLQLQSPPIKAPIALDDVGSGLKGAGKLFDAMAALPLNPWLPLILFKQWSEKGQLILSFHYYPGILTSVKLEEMVSLARTEARELGGNGTAIWLSEYWNGHAQSSANTLAKASNLGCDAVTYWHYVNMTYTNTSGWYKYSQEIWDLGGAAGEPFSQKGVVNWASWPAYEQSVRDGTFWGAGITGAGGGKMDVLQLMPDMTARGPPSKPDVFLGPGGYLPETGPLAELR